MFSAVQQYRRDLFIALGRGWNRFWYLPGDPMLLGVLRVATGLAALYVLYSYSFDLATFFSSQGLLPVESLELIDERRSWSILDGIHTARELRIFHGIAIFIVALFSVGLFTRVTAILSLVIMLSYLQRASVLVTPVEPIVTMLLCYLSLAPSGAYCSLDRWLARRRDPSLDERPPQASFAATISLRLIQIHLCLIYFAGALAKLAPASGAESEQPWWSGRAMWWVLARPDYRWIDLTGFFSGAPLLVNLWTHAVVAFELLFGVVIWNRVARPLVLALAVLFWMGHALATGQGAFSLLMLAAHVSFVSPAFCRELVASFRNRSREHVRTSSDA